MLTLNQDPNFCTEFSEGQEFRDVFEDLVDKKAPADEITNEKSTSQVDLLEHEWVIYYDGGAPLGISDQKFNTSMHVLGSFSSIQGFWRYWNNISFDRFSIGSNVRLFKKNIKPTWEDEANKNGGKLVIQSPKNISADIWTTIVISLIGEQFAHSDDLCGAVFSVRQKATTINIWTNRADDQEQINSTMKLVMELIGFGVGCKFEYTSHMKTAHYNESAKKSQPESRNSAKKGKQSKKVSKPTHSLSSVREPTNIVTPARTAPHVPKIAAAHPEALESELCQSPKPNAQDVVMSLPVHMSSGVSGLKSLSLVEESPVRPEEPSKHRRCVSSGDSPAAISHGFKSNRMDSPAEDEDSLSLGGVSIGSDLEEVAFPRKVYFLDSQLGKDSEHKKDKIVSETPESSSDHKKRNKRRKDKKKRTTLAQPEPADHKALFKLALVLLMLCLTCVAVAVPFAIPVSQ
eukprot:TRINITY_DN8019_c0_g1_i1.p1 TRINITY_DN8019_c0_g1~~TRINITY_DN8019_c0_g1_i1.p1  ORF type:complete len:460 (-),score=140.59 TRINITY_DN8019_c0_g1_i1:117-1496(-)